MYILRTLLETIFTLLSGTEQLEPRIRGNFLFTRTSNFDCCCSEVSVFLVSSCHICKEFNIKMTNFQRNSHK